MGTGPGLLEGVHQRGPAVVVAGVDLSARNQQQRNDLEAVGTGPGIAEGVHQRGLVDETVDSVDVSAVFYQPRDDLGAWGAWGAWGIGVGTVEGDHQRSGAINQDTQHITTTGVRVDALLEPIRHRSQVAGDDRSINAGESDRLHLLHLVQPSFIDC